MPSPVVFSGIFVSLKHYKWWRVCYLKSVVFEDSPL